MWILTTLDNASTEYAILANKKYIVGRSDSDIIICDRSVSRHHAKLFYNKSDLSLSVEDISKFGTSINQKPMNGSTSIVVSGSNITFGAMPGITMRAEFRQLNVIFSSVSPQMLPILKDQCISLGAKLLQEWSPTCNLLIMSKLIVTQKVLYSLLQGVSIVQPSYIVALLKACQSVPFIEPDKSLFLPFIQEKGFTNSDEHKFRVQARRATIFNGKTFFFLTEAKFQRFKHLLSLTSAQVKCLTSPMSIDESYDNDSFNDPSVKSYLTDLFIDGNACIVYESTTSIAFTPSQHYWHQLLYDVLKELNLRPILDQEIAFAIIDGSCLKLCNTKVNCDDRILNQPGTPRDYLFDVTANKFTTDTFSTNDLLLASYNKTVSIKRQNQQSNEDEIQPSVKKRRTNLNPLSSLLPPKRTIKLHSNAQIIVPDTEDLNTSIYQPSKLPSDTRHEFTQSNSSFQEPTSSTSAWFQFETMPTLSSLISKKSILTNCNKITPLGKNKFNEIEHSKTEITGVISCGKENIDPSLTSVTKQLSSVNSFSTNEDENLLNTKMLTTQQNITNEHYSSPETSITHSPTNVKDSEKLNVGTALNKILPNLNNSIEEISSPIRTPMASSTSSKVNFKRFQKVWPLSFRINNKEIPHNNYIPVESKVVLVPFVPSNGSILSKKCENVPITNQCQQNATYNNKIMLDKLFDQITALPNIKRR